MPAPKKKKPAAQRRPYGADVEPPAEPIRDHGKVVTAPAGTSEEAVINKLAGVDDVPSLDQLSQAKKPPFDPHAGREVEQGREFGDTAEPMISTLVFMGVDYGGDFEDTIQSLVNEADKLGLHDVTASIAKLDLNEHFMALDEMDENPPDEEPLDEEPS